MLINELLDIPVELTDNMFLINRYSGEVKYYEKKEDVEKNAISIFFENTSYLTTLISEKPNKKQANILANILEKRFKEFLIDNIYPLEWCNICYNEILLPITKYDRIDWDILEKSKSNNNTYKVKDLFERIIYTEDNNIIIKKESITKETLKDIFVVDINNKIINLLAFYAPYDISDRIITLIKAINENPKRYIIKIKKDITNIHIVVKKLENMIINKNYDWKTIENMEIHI